MEEGGQSMGGNYFGCKDLSLRHNGYLYFDHGGLAKGVGRNLNYLIL